jgi:hypothetical protein
MSDQLVTVTGRYVLADDTPAQGTVLLTPVVVAGMSADTKRLVTRHSVAGRLDPQGTVTLTVLASDDPDWMVDGPVLYEVAEYIAGARGKAYQVHIPGPGISTWYPFPRAPAMYSATSYRTGPSTIQSGSSDARTVRVTVPSESRRPTTECLVTSRFTAADMPATTTGVSRTVPCAGVSSARTYRPVTVTSWSLITAPLRPGCRGRRR